MIAGHGGREMAAAGIFEQDGAATWERPIQLAAIVAVAVAEADVVPRRISKDAPYGRQHEPAAGQA